MYIISHSDKRSDGVQTKDIEASAQAVSFDDSAKIDKGGVLSETKRTKEIQNKFSILRKLNNLEAWMDRKLGRRGFVETGGADRIPEDNKQPPSIWNTMLIWISFVMHVGILPIGFLGPQFGLSFNQSMTAAVIGITTGSCFPAYTCLFGAKLGLRQMAACRYAFGFWGARLCAVLTIVVSIGFNVVNTVVVGQLLSAVSDFKLPLAVGSIIISLISYALSITGFRLVHVFNKYAWVLALILFIVLYAQTASHVNISAPASNSGLVGAGAWLSFMSITFANSSGWCCIAADYYCNYPATFSKKKMFLLTWLGVTLPGIFTVTLGIVLGNATLTAEYPPYSDAYAEHGLGGLLLEAYNPEGWFRFALVMCVFTVVSNNIPTIYSCGLSLQLLGYWFHAVPRFIWSLNITIVIAVFAIAGREHLSTIVSNFVSMLGYWAVCFTLIIAIEDSVFRRTAGYELEAWNNPDRLPVGAAATFALVAGYCGGGVPGMSQTWFVGPVAAKFGGYGGDVGIFLSGAIALVVYPVGRYFEKRLTGR